MNINYECEYFGGTSRLDGLSSSFLHQQSDFVFRKVNFLKHQFHGLLVTIG